MNVMPTGTPRAVEGQQWMLTDTDGPNSCVRSGSHVVPAIRSGCTLFIGSGNKGAAMTAATFNSLDTSFPGL
jgi:hypothetical protein